MRIFLIDEYIKQFVNTVFRQVMFAEFEAEAHAMTERNEALTLAGLNNLYRNLEIKYYGSAITLDEKSDLTWARIPYFYRAFYVYQYATGYTTSVAFAKKILGKGQDNAKTDESRNAYLDFLKSGCSDYPINILKKAGIDLSTPTPIQESLFVFEEIISELEKMLKM